jgi:hypothetical protein
MKTQTHILKTQKNPKKLFFKKKKKFDYWRRPLRSAALLSNPIQVNPR